MSEIEITADKNRLDIDFINAFISNSYWAKDRPLDTMKICVDNSLNFGVYFRDRQIGFARVVTDYGQFAYIMDLFIDEKHRGKGYSKELMKYIMEFEALKKIKIWRLATRDAHDLYKKFGFRALANPENLMELMR